MQTKEHFKNLYDVVREDGVKAALGCDVKETLKRHPLLTSLAFRTIGLFDAPELTPLQADDSLVEYHCKTKSNPDDGSGIDRKSYRLDESPLPMQIASPYVGVDEVRDKINLAVIKVLERSHPSDPELTRYLKRLCEMESLQMAEDTMKSTGYSVGRWAVPDELPRLGVTLPNNDPHYIVFPQEVSLELVKDLDRRSKKLESIERLAEKVGDAAYLLALPERESLDHPINISKGDINTSRTKIFDYINLKANENPHSLFIQERRYRGSFFDSQSPNTGISLGLYLLSAQIHQRKTGEGK